MVEIKEKGRTRRRADRGKEYTTRHRFHYVNHVTRKLLATEFVPENARHALNEKGDPRSGTWGANSCDTTRGVSTRNTGWNQEIVILMSVVVNLTSKDKKVESQSIGKEQKGS